MARIEVKTDMKSVSCVRHCSVMHQSQLKANLHSTIFAYNLIACNFNSTRCSRHGKIVYNFHNIKLPVHVATIVVGF